jgi:hypothetical protein
MATGTKWGGGFKLDDPIGIKRGPSPGESSAKAIRMGNDAQDRILQRGMRQGTPSERLRFAAAWEQKKNSTPGYTTSYGHIRADGEGEAQDASTAGKLEQAARQLESPIQTRQQFLGPKEQFAKDLLSSNLIKAGDVGALDLAYQRGGAIGVKKDQIVGFLNQQQQKNEPPFDFNQKGLKDGNSIAPIVKSADAIEQSASPITQANVAQPDNEKSKPPVNGGAAVPTSSGQQGIAKPVRDKDDGGIPDSNQMPTNPSVDDSAKLFESDTSSWADVIKQNAGSKTEVKPSDSAPAFKRSSGVSPDFNAPPSLDTPMYYGNKAVERLEKSFAKMEEIQRESNSNESLSATDKATLLNLDTKEERRALMYKELDKTKEKISKAYALQKADEDAYFEHDKQAALEGSQAPAPPRAMNYNTFNPDTHKPYSKENGVARATLGEGSTIEDAADMHAQKPDYWDGLMAEAKSQKAKSSSLDSALSEDAQGLKAVAGDILHVGAGMFSAAPELVAQGVVNTLAAIPYAGGKLASVGQSVLGSIPLSTAQHLARNSGPDEFNEALSSKLNAVKGAIAKPRADFANDYLDQRAKEHKKSRDMEIARKMLGHFERKKLAEKTIATAGNQLQESATDRARILPQ